MPPDLLLWQPLLNTQHEVATKKQLFNFCTKFAFLLHDPCTAIATNMHTIESLLMNFPPISLIMLFHCFAQNFADKNLIIQFL